MVTVRELLSAAKMLPAQEGRRDVEILLCHCLDKPRSWLFSWPEAEVNPEREQLFQSLLSRRIQGEPIAYLVGEREFWSLRLSVNEHTLIPRSETETLVEWALELPLPAHTEALDLGTGSGAIALAVARERPAWQVTGLDRSRAALQVAQSNALQHSLDQVRFLQSDWFGAVVGQCFHLLMSNPPYVAEGDPHLARGDLPFEPRSALVSPDGGQADLIKLVHEAPAHLHAGGWLLLEHGYQQGEAVRGLMSQQGFEKIATKMDYAGLDRVTGGCWRAE